MKRSYLFLMMAVALPFSSCNKDDNDPKVIIQETIFNDGADGWEAVYAEYPDGQEEFYELESGLKNLPAQLDQTKKAFMLSGNNHSDALQMFLVKRLDGLSPQTHYIVETGIELASKYPDGSVGIGGSPGNSVYLVSKFATNGYELQEGENEHDNIKLFLKEIDSVPESVMTMDLGDVSIQSDEYEYQLITREKSSSPNVVQSDAQGKLWAIIGTWSGFEGISTLYYTKIKITLTKK